MLNYKPNIVHFSGHGLSTDDSGGRLGIVLEDEDNNIKIISK